MSDIHEQTARNYLAWMINLEYKGIQIQDRNISGFLGRVRDWYHEAQGVIQNFGCFMPFIKLTAKEKIFSQDLEELEGLTEWDYAKQLYLNNRDKVIIYKKKLAETPKKFAVGIFEVDCS